MSQGNHHSWYYEHIIERRFTEQWFLVIDISPRCYIQASGFPATFQQSGNQSSGLQSVWNTAKIRSEPAALEESRAVMTFVNMLVVKKVIHSFRPVLWKSPGRELLEWSRLEFSVKISESNFVLDTEVKNVRPLNRGDKRNCWKH